MPFTWLMIADGSTDRAEAQRKLDALKEHVFPARLAAGYPQLVESATMPGLKPGFFVVVLGSCADRSEADVHLELMRAVAPGAYVRSVEGPSACPTLQASDPGAARGGPVVGSHPFAATSKTTLEVRRPASLAECPNQHLAVEVKLEFGGVVSRLSLSGTCEPGVSTSSWADPRPVNVDGLTLLAMRSVDTTGGAAVASDVLYGFVCGGWRPLIGPLVAGAGQTRFDSPGGRQIRAQMWSNAEAAGPPSQTQLYTLDPVTCAATTPLADLSDL